MANHQSQSSPTTATGLNVKQHHDVLNGFRGVQTEQIKWDASNLMKRRGLPVSSIQKSPNLCSRHQIVSNKLTTKEIISAKLPNSVGLHTACLQNGHQR
jgi:hypothetical protein